MLHKEAEVADSLFPAMKLPRPIAGWNRVDEGIGRVESMFRLGAFVTVSLWLVLVWVVFRYAPADSYEEPQGTERTTHMACCFVLLITNGSRILPLFARDFDFRFFKSGFLVAALSIQVVAITSNFLMFYLPTPVMLDEISGLRFHLLRWAEWPPLCFMMTFLTCNVDAPLRIKEGLFLNFTYPTMLGLSTICGMLFPFCKTFRTWMLVMAISWLLFFSVYVLVYRKAKNYYNLKKAKSSAPPFKPSSVENFGLTKSAFTLSVVCSVTWTCLAGAFTIASFASKNASSDSFLGNPSLPVLMTSFFEIASKIWYLSAIIDVYDKVFDENARAVRRLEDLRNFMSAVWATSSDVIVFCVQHEDHISARISPAFLKLLGHSTRAPVYLGGGDVSLILEIDPEKDTCHVFAMDLSKSVTRQEALQFKNKITSRNYQLSRTADEYTTDDRNLINMAKLVVKACQNQQRAGDSEFFQSFIKMDGDAQKEISCEATIADLDSGSCVLVLRDISDRLCRFEAEKKLLQEMTSRKKDAAANSFTRHEVKNSLLAAIALLDHLGELLQRNHVIPPDTHARQRLGSFSSREIHPLTTLSSHIETLSGEITSQRNEFQESVAELDSTLHDMLDTILDEAMAREIVYGQYKPKEERLLVPAVLDSLRRRTSQRFPLEVVPDPFPLLAMDRQLLRYIYRNAVSNACKYGEADGVVETSVKYDHSEQRLTMQVVNLPGEGHDELVDLLPEQVASVFAPETRLRPGTQANCRKAQAIQNESSGNGAWIMQKCAQAMGGECNIRFDPESTVFTFSCPIAAANHVPVKEKPFCLPNNTWGVAIDDSRIQRKLMDRFLSSAGIENSRRIVLGANAEEVYGFGDKVKHVLQNHPEDKVLLIVDENLDIVDGGACHQTVSGSLSVQQLRSEIDQATEGRLLALIRSANDSADDIELYEERSHGFLLKQPVKKDGALGLIRPLWQERFPCEYADKGHASRADIDLDIHGPSAEDIREALRVIQALSSVENEAVLQRRWYPMREKLHALKGDLMSMFPKHELVGILESIDNLLSSSRLPHDFHDKWNALKAQVESLIM